MQPVWGSVQLTIERNANSHSIEIPAGPWTARVRPVLTDEAEEIFQRGQEAEAAGNPSKAIGHWRSLTAREGASADPFFPTWIELRQAIAWLGSKTPERFEDGFRRALAEAELADDPRAAAAAWELRADVLSRRGRWQEARVGYLETAELLEAASGRDLVLAHAYNRITVASFYLGDVGDAIRHATLNLELCQALAAGTTRHANALSNLGVMVDERGDLAKAEDWYRQALRVVQGVDPGGFSEAVAHNNLGVSIAARGQFTEAEVSFLKAYELFGPEHPQALEALNNLGVLAAERHALDLAARRLREVRALRMKLDPEGFPGSFEDSNLTYNEGIIAQRRGDDKSAEKLFLEALAMRRSDDGKDHAGMTLILQSLGTVYGQQGKFRRAESYFLRALAVQENVESQGIRTADAHIELGKLLWRRDRSPRAREHLERALAIYQRLAPGSWTEAETLHELGKTRHESGDLDGALQFFERAVAALETQGKHWGGSEQTQAGLRARYRNLYRSLIEALLERQRGTEAFSVLERYYGRIFLAMLAQRDLALGQDLTEPIRALEEKSRRLAVLYDRELARLSAASLADDEAIIAAHGRLQGLLDERANLIRRIQLAAPRIAALKYPEPLGFEDMRALLVPGTAMLSYSVGERQTDIFVVAPGRPLAVHTVTIGEAALRQEIDRFRELIQEPRNRRHPHPPGGVIPLGRTLFQRLVAPALSHLEGTERLMIVPDGPLHALPFGALVVGGQGSREKYLIEWKSFHIVLSGTVYGTIISVRPPVPPKTPGPKIVALGDPAYKTPGTTDQRGTSRASVVLSLEQGFEQLPQTRPEVLGLQQIFGEAAEIYLGPDATEARAKAIPRATRYVHFASHGVFDALTPLNSALALATIAPALPESDGNGLLQAWEIMEQLRLEATLVTLSACETGRGREFGGEGLIGLARAFLHAGTRSVLVSLWKISDSSTAKLMLRFYQHLENGMSKSEALRAAQVGLLRGAKQDASGHRVYAPYFWAAFQLIGEG